MKRRQSSKEEEGRSKEANRPLSAVSASTSHVEVVSCCCDSESKRRASSSLVSIFQPSADAPARFCSPRLEELPADGLQNGGHSQNGGAVGVPSRHSGTMACRTEGVRCVSHPASRVAVEAADADSSGPWRSLCGSRTGVVLFGASRHCDPHKLRHPERELRIAAIRRALVDAGLLRRCRVVLDDADDRDSDSRDGDGDDAVVAAAVELPDEDFARVHLPSYLQRLSRLSSSSDDDLHREAGQYTSLYLTRDSYAEARIASSALCELVRLVLAGELDNGFAATRPPGHHASQGMAGGYCLLNHVAVAAAYARSLPTTRPCDAPVDRVLIVDWDVHHGNGTQEIFFQDPSVLCVSIHRWHVGQYYPFESKGGPATVGVCPGGKKGDPPRSTTVNVGWTRAGMGDAEYRAAWQLLVLPLAREFRPDLVLVSAGFDAADGDSGGDCRVTPSYFGALARQLQFVAPRGRVVASLEGGYAVGVLGRCASSVVEALLAGDIGDSIEPPWPSPASAQEADTVLCGIDPVAAQNLRATADAHRPYWKCLQLA